MRYLFSSLPRKGKSRLIELILRSRLRGGDVLGLLPILILAACSVGPNYKRPPAETATYFKEQPGWVLAQPQLPGANGDWWAIYDDAELNLLESEIDLSNQNVAQAEAAYHQAQAVVAAARSAYFPTLTANFGLDYSQSGRSRSSSGTAVVSGASTTTTSTAGSVAGATAGGVSTGGNAGGTLGGTASQGATLIESGSSAGGVSRIYNLNGGFSWDVDVWGRIRRTVEEDVALAQANAADVQAVRLAAQGTLAEDYFELRGEDQLQILLDETVKAYKQSLQITVNQYNAGVAAQSDVINARTLLETTESSAINIEVSRQQLEHAIALLIGKPPAELAIPPAPLTVNVPLIPVDVPSTLLERRPDIAQAEREMQAENAAIGVAIAAYYPDLTLSANYGYDNSSLTNLVSAANREWSGGPSIAETLFDGGLRSAEIEEARALYAQSVATYRQTVLTALQSVEDSLVQQRVYTQQAVVLNAAVSDAEKAVQLELNQYKAGTTVFSNVIQAQTTALADEETAVTLRENRLTASVALIEDMGGGWDQTALPTRDQVEDPTFEGTVPDACDAGGILTNPGCW